MGKWVGVVGIDRIPVSIYESAIREPCNNRQTQDIVPRIAIFRAVVVSRILTGWRIRIYSGLTTN
jgi:hypothetical protein